MFLWEEWTQTVDELSPETSFVDFLNIHCYSLRLSVPSKWWLGVWNSIASYEARSDHNMILLFLQMASVRGWWAFAQTADRPSILPTGWAMRSWYVVLLLWDHRSPPADLHINPRQKTLQGARTVQWRFYGLKKLEASNTAYNLYLNSTPNCLQRARVSIVHPHQIHSYSIPPLSPLSCLSLLFQHFKGELFSILNTWLSNKSWSNDPNNERLQVACPIIIIAIKNF